MSPAARRTAFAILALALGGFAIGTTEFVTMGLLPQIADGTGVDIATAGHYVSAYALGVVIGAPLIAVMAAKVPRKGLLMALMSFFAVAHIAIAFADTYPTVMAARFLAGIPHGAFFGIGSVVAASLVSHQRRTAAVATLLGGLGVANVIGVPLATLLGQRYSWHLPYLVVGVVAVVTVAAIGVFLPHQSPSGEESMRSEMRALRRLQVWLALLIGVVGFGGMFAMYSFITPTMTELAGLDERYIPWVLAAYGIGMVAGMVLSGRVANRVGVLKGIIIALLRSGRCSRSSAGPPRCCGWPSSWSSCSGCCPRSSCRCSRRASWTSRTRGSPLRPPSTTRRSTPPTPSVPGSARSCSPAGWGYGAPSLVGAVLAVLGVGVAVLSAVLERRSRAATSTSERQSEVAVVASATTNA